MARHILAWHRWQNYHQIPLHAVVNLIEERFVAVRTSHHFLLMDGHYIFVVSDTGN